LREESAFSASPGSFAFVDLDRRGVALLGDSVLARGEYSQSDWCLALLVGPTCLARVDRVRPAFSAFVLATQWSPDIKELSAMDLAIALPVARGNGRNGGGRRLYLQG